MPSRIELLLEANDQATAVLAKVREQIKGTSSEANNASVRLGKTADGIDRIGGSEAQIHKSARAMSSLAFAAESARLGSLGAVSAIGSLATTAAELTPFLAEWAIPIGATIALLGTAISIVNDTQDESTRLAAFQERLSKQTLSRLEDTYSGIQQQREKALKDVADAADGFWDRMARHADPGIKGAAQDLAYKFGFIGDPTKTAALSDANEKSVDALKALEEARDQDRIRLITLKDQTQEMIRQKSVALDSSRAQLAVLKQAGTQADAQAVAAKAQLAAENASVIAMFRHRDAEGNLVTLTRQEISDRGRLLSLNQAAYKLTVEEAQLKELQREKDARFAANTALAQLQAQARGASDPELQRIQAQIQYQQKLEEINRGGYAPELATYLRDVAVQAFNASNAITALQVAFVNQQIKTDIDQNSENPMEQYRGRLEAIQMDREAAIRSGADRVLIERRTQQQIRALQRDTIEGAKENYASLEEVLIASKSREIHGVGEAMRSVRKVILGYEAAEATVNAFKYGAKAVGYAADLKFGQAATAAAAALQFAKVAAIAGQESLGGGGASSAGGGGSSTQASSFEPRNSTQGAGGVNITLVTRDPYGRDSIQNAMYAINRAGTLGVPAIQIPPTTGVRRVA